MDSLVAGMIVAGRYRLEQPLAAGGMGSVWVGRHLQLDVPVAIKLMAPALAASADARARFEREAKASALLRSVHAVHVYDRGVEGDMPFIVMELLDGEDLDARLRRAKRLSPAATHAILEQAGRALRGAHELGLVHRDLKPGNLFLARQAGGEEIVKVLDFGIVKAEGLTAGAHATKTGALLGSPHYMSPEQVRSSHKVDLRTDVWALGVITFQCLTGRLPFSGDEVGEVLVEVCTAPIPRPSSIAADLGPEVDRFIERALARDPAQRFQSVGELLGALAALAGAAPAVSMGGAPSTPMVQAPPATPRPLDAAPAETLSPSEHTQPGRAPAGRGARVAIGVAVAGTVALIAAAGLGVARLSTSTSHGAASTASPAATSSPAAAPSVTAEPVAGATASAPSVTAEPEPAPATSTSASASPSASAGAPPFPKPPRAKGTPGPSRKKDDLLNHM